MKNDFPGRHEAGQVATKGNMAATRKRGANKARTEGTKSEIGNMQFWRGLAEDICPDLDKKADAFEIGEIAVALQQACSLVGQEQKTISRTCEKNEDKKVSFSLTVSIDRRTSPPEVAVSISYAERHRDSLKAKVPDPNQTELPGLDESEVTDGTGPAEQQELGKN